MDDGMIDIISTAGKGVTEKDCALVQPIMDAFFEAADTGTTTSPNCHSSTPIGSRLSQLFHIACPLARLDLLIHQLEFSIGSKNVLANSPLMRPYG
jgi:hypothetical protein